ncbi:guanine nucleotide binding protein, alpha subunit [Crepidotus variabilis]|uniref:Guanine nucleotide binding protein, alpha subunit n=1 Tax=Crepidotus variabilis TaxID=179855 RepID=A0A9P6JL07_9AGAR|nr:guanine nucleotide binding protein, alpha subunit [Crepidotus variabilis]
MRNTASLMGVWNGSSVDIPQKGRKSRQDQKAEAKRISDLIDEQLKMTVPKVKVPARVLVLGQSDVAKFTAIQNFCRHYAPAFLEGETAKWRLKSQLNATRSIISVIETLQAEIDDEDEYSRPVAQPTLTEEISAQTTRESENIIGSSADQMVVESILPNSVMEHYGTLRASAESLRQLASHLQYRNVASLSFENGPPNGDVVTFKKLEVLQECLEAVKALWSCEIVKELMTTVGHRQLDESAIYCLDNLDRISQHYFEPTNEDMLRACQRNASIQEYRVKLEPSCETNASNAASECFFYDIGGMRRLRKVWMTYLDNLDAVVFLASMSCFDEHLTDQPSVNRLEDTLNLWSSISRSNLLDQAQTFLFLTDTELLEKKLDAGILFKKFIPSYENENLLNDAPSVIKYLRAAFRKSGPRIGRSPKLHIFEIPDSNSDVISITIKEHILDATTQSAVSA